MAIAAEVLAKNREKRKLIDLWNKANTASRERQKEVDRYKLALKGREMHRSAIRECKSNIQDLAERINNTLEDEIKGKDVKPSSSTLEAQLMQCRKNLKHHSKSLDAIQRIEARHKPVAYSTGEPEYRAFSHALNHYLLEEFKSYRKDVLQDIADLYYLYSLTDSHYCSRSPDIGGFMKNTFHFPKPDLHAAMQRIEDSLSESPLKEAS